MASAPPPPSLTIEAMRRWPPHLIAAALAAAAVALAIGWVAVFALHEPILGLPVWGDLPGTRWFAFVDRWSCGVGRVRSVDLDALGEPAASRWPRRRLDDRRVLGCGIVRGQSSYIETVEGPQYHGPKYGGIVADEWTQLAVPAGIVIPLLAGFPAAHWRRTFRRRRRSCRGQCLACGYDLRATAGRCPECGFAAGEPAAGH
jgi:rubredoxin